MDPHIEKVKKTILSIIQNARAKFPNHRFKVGFVAYRDFDCGVKSIEVKNFTEKIDEVVEFIGKLEAKGGKDIAEDVIGGLEAGLKLSFNAAGMLCCFFIADAPSHGE